MGKGIVYCQDCGKVLPEDLFGRGKAHWADERPYCTACRAPDPTPPTGTVPKVSTRTLRPPAPAPRPAARPAARLSARTPFYVGGALAGAAVLVLVAVLLSGGSAPPPAPAPADPGPPAKDKALEAIEEIEAFAAQEIDPDAILARCGRARPLVSGTRYAARLGKVEARAVDLRLSRAKEKEAQFVAFLEAIRKMIREDEEFVRRAEVQGMVRSAGSQAGARAAEVERLRADYEKLFDDSARKAVEAALAEAGKLDAAEKFADALERLESVPAAFLASPSAGPIGALREKIQGRAAELDRLARLWKEGEDLKVLRTSGVVQAQDLKALGSGWSQGVHLWWREAKPGDAIALEFPSNVAGRRKLVLQLTKAPDYGIVRLSVNGAVLAESLDLFHGAGVVPSGELAFDADLRKGPNELRVELTGTNPSAKPAHYMFGLDYLRIE